MIKFNTTILKFASQGEKTGWSYIEISAKLAKQLSDSKKAFRVKGILDDYEFEGVSLLPMGEGNFIMALNATMRKTIKKQKGDKVLVKLEIDKKPFEIPAWIMECIEVEPNALKYFESLPKSHQHYFIKWILSAKTEATITRRAAQAVNAFVNGMTYSEMLHYERDKKV